MDNNKKSLSFWVVLICFVLGLLETVFLSINLDYLLNIIIEAVAILLSILVYFGVLKGKKKNITQEYQDIKKTIKDSLDKKSSNNINFGEEENSEIEEKKANFSQTEKISKKKENLKKKT